MSRGACWRRVDATALSMTLWTLILLAWWLQYEFRSMFIYEFFRKGTFKNGILGWARIDADDCTPSRRPPARPTVDVLTSYWTAHPCMTNANCSKLATAGAGQSTLYPHIWQSARANQEAAVHLLNISTYAVGGGELREFHGPGMHALCAKIRYVSTLLRNEVAEGHWLVLIDADAGFRCSALCDESSAHNVSIASSHNNKRHRCAGLEDALWRVSYAAWMRRRSDPSFLVFSAFGFFAVRNDAGMRSLFSSWVGAMETRPFMCLFSTVPDVAAFHEVYGDHGDAGDNAARRCSLVYAPEIEQELVHHIAGQARKSDKAQVKRFTALLNRESQCIRRRLEHGNAAGRRRDDT